MKKLNIVLFVSLVALFFGACSEQVEKSVSQKSKSEQVSEEVNPVADSKGYELMKSKCYACHFEKPDPSKRGQMIAPPMLRVQEHYLPNYPEKEEFVQAVMSMVKNPTEEKSLMPGALRKFNLMPKLPYNDDELRLIVEALYSMDFDNVPKGKMHGTLALNDGEKWVVKAESYKVVQDIENDLKKFNAENVEAYNQLGKDVFGKMKVILMDKSYSGELFEQLHNFFSGIESKTHALIAEKDLAKAKKITQKLSADVHNFYSFFQSK